MRVDVVLRYIGVVMLFIAMFMLLSAGISYLSGMDSAFYPLLLSSLLTALLAAVVCIAAAEAAVPQTPPQGVKGGSVSLERFRGKKSIVRGGRMPLPDSLRRDSLGRDSLRAAGAGGGGRLPGFRVVIRRFLPDRPPEFSGIAVCRRCGRDFVK